MSQCFQVKVKGAFPHNIAEEMRRWYSYPLFVGIECVHRQVSAQLDATYFYPEPGDLRQRLAALQADPSPILEAVKHWWWSSPEEQGDYTQHIPPILEIMREFVDCYEEAVAKKTDWVPRKRLCLVPCDDEIIQEQEEHLEESVPNPPDSSSLVDGEDFNVQFGDPSLMEQEFETVPDEMHRWPYIVLG